MSKQFQDYGVFGAFLVFLLAPALSTLLGFRAQPFEERPIAEFPPFSLDRVTDPAFYKSFDDALIAQNPLRETAVKLNARLNYRLFGDVDSRRVFPGKEGWLFYYETIYGDCQSKSEIKVQVDNVSRLAKALEQANKPYVLTITPDKVSIFPDKLSRLGHETGACRFKNRQSLQEVLRDSDLRYFNSWQAMQDLRDTETIPVYIKDETHWTQYGSAQFIAHVVQLFEPNLARDGLEEIGKDRILPDLGRMTGLYILRDMPMVRFLRAGNQIREANTVEHGGQGRDYVINRSTTTGAPLSDKRVFVLHDSFMYVAWGQLSQYFSDTIYMHWTAVTPERFAEFVQAADIVIIQSVERETVNRLGVHFSDDSYQVALERQLAQDQNSVLEFWPK